MTRRLHHPLWTHVPAAMLVIVMVAAVIVSGPFPDRAPVHFGRSGPDRFGSPWEVLGGMLALSILYLAVSVFLDELWARQQKGGSFNWLSLFDEAAVGLLCGLGLSYMRLLKGQGSAPADWRLVALTTVPAIVFAVVIEILRPWSPDETLVTAENTQELEAELRSRTICGARSAYWENQNPWYVSILIIAASSAMIWGAAGTWKDQPAASVALLSGVLVFAFFGGIRVAVTPERLTVRLGLIGIPILRVNLKSIAAVEVKTFSPLRDFGGYGIRFNRHMKAYFLRGNRGVLVTGENGRKTLIGSDHPERLEAVIRVMREDRPCEPH